MKSKQRKCNNNNKYLKIFTMLFFTSEVMNYIHIIKFSATFIFNAENNKTVQITFCKSR